MDFTNTKRAPNYEKIRSLATQLQQGGAVRKKREIALQLEQMLSNVKIRKKLAEEATPATTTSSGPDDLSIAARQCHALSRLWSAVFTAAIVFSISSLKGKGKTMLEDIVFPDKLLRASAGPDETFDTKGLKGIPKLSKKTVRGLLKFCLQMLENDTVIEIGGERIMLEMLTRLCSKAEYMGFFKYAADFQCILSEVTLRMNEQRVSVETHIAACKAFDALFDTGNHLGIQLHMFLSDSLQLVSQYCKNKVQENAAHSISTSRLHLFNAVASMLLAHPEHSIGPMKRYGRNFLRYCKRAYANAPSNHRDVFNRYLLAHL